MRLPVRPLVVAVVGLLAGCSSSHVRPDVTPPALPILPEVPLESLPAMPVVLAADSVSPIIAAAEREFELGRGELDLGHLVAAREAFDRAVDVLLAAPDGARADARLAAAFDRLIDRVNALEVTALREGDGFSGRGSEPAAIDELLGAATFEFPQPTPLTAATVATDVATTSYDLPMAVNAKVLSYIELYQGRLRDFMQGGLTRSARYLPMIEDVLREEGLPLDLAWVPLVESAFKPTALSRASARGMWQFMQGTAVEHGLAVTWFLDERADPEKATRAAAQYLRTLAGMFGGDWHLALAGYNAGPGRVQRAMKQSKRTDYWDLTAGTRYLPRETREYVPMILAAIIVAKNPEHYGFEVAPQVPLAVERVNVPDALDLRLVAEWAGVTIDEIRDLNPELRRGTTPVGSHDVKVPLGTAASVQARLEAADPSAFTQFQRHVVRRGETLASIARQFKVSRADLAAANRLRTTAALRTGQSLIIPRASATVVASGPAPAPVAAAGPHVYRVQRGDTLYSIARQFDTTVEMLKRLNRLSSDRIVAGDRLTVRR